MSIVETQIEPASIDLSAVRAGEAVRGVTWSTAASLINTLTAKGGQLVVANSPASQFAIGAHSLRYYTWPRALSSTRVWIVWLVSTSTTPTEVEISDGASAVLTAFVNASVSGVPAWNLTAAPPSPVIYIATQAASSTPAELVLDLNVITAAVYVQGVSCFELPRRALTSGATELAADATAPGNAIYETDGLSIYGVAQACEAGRTNHRRANFHWYDPTGFTTTSGTFADVLTLPPKVLGRAGSDADGSTISVAWAARVVTTGGDAEIRVTAASGDSDTITANGAAAWYTGTITIDREDLSDADTGGQGARPLGDALTFEARITTASTMTVTGLAVSEAL